MRSEGGGHRRGSQTRSFSISSSLFNRSPRALQAPSVLPTHLEQGSRDLPEARKAHGIHQLVEDVAALEGRLAQPPEGRRRSLVEYLASLERFVRIDPLVVLPGHGPRFQDVPTLTEAMRHHHDSRADEILDAVRRLGNATPYELSGELFPHIRDFSIMLGVSEVVGHLDLLEDDGKLVRSDAVPHRYAPA